LVLNVDFGHSDNLSGSSDGRGDCASRGAGSGARRARGCGCGSRDINRALGAVVGSVVRNWGNGDRRNTSRLGDGLGVDDVSSAFALLADGEGESIVTSSGDMADLIPDGDGRGSGAVSLGGDAFGASGCGRWGRRLGVFAPWSGSRSSLGWSWCGSWCL
jgi:hypothetical protein